VPEQQGRPRPACAGAWPPRSRRAPPRSAPPRADARAAPRRSREPPPPAASLLFPQAKNTNATGSQAFWPKNATTQMLALLGNAEANAKFKNLKEDSLYVKHVSCNMAPKGRRRTYRAHGRIGPYMSTPSHIEIVLAEAHEAVAKEKDLSLPTKLKVKFAKRHLVAEGVVA
jgi:ribosomal protein L22